MSGVNPQGVAVHSFKVPSAEELDHDYLWRYAQRLPARGEIGIFNRSHYEEVLVVRVHPEILERQKLPEGGDARRRLEAALPRDQRLGALPHRQRLPHRQAVPQPLEGGAATPLPAPDRPARTTTGSSRTADVARARATGTTTRRRSREMLSHTSTEWAPWYVIPADRKWFLRIGAAAVLVNTLIEIDPRFPRVSEDTAAACSRSRGASRRRHPRAPRPTRSRRSRG